jgi:hypothetical protein
VQVVGRVSSLTLRVDGYLSYHREKLYCHSIVETFKKPALVYIMFMCAFHPEISSFFE